MAASRRDDGVETVFGPPVHAYATRAQAIADGALVDVTQTAREAGFRVPVALTAGVWEDVRSIPPSKRGIQDADGRLWDLLWMARAYALRALRALRAADASEVAVELIMPVGRRRSYRAKLTIGPGDAGEPVATVLRPHED